MFRLRWLWSVGLHDYRSILTDSGYAVLIYAQYGGDVNAHSGDFAAFSLEYMAMGQEVNLRGDLLRQVNGFKLPQ
jgi:hypothetical protein